MRKSGMGYASVLLSPSPLKPAPALRERGTKGVRVPWRVEGGTSPKSTPGPLDPNPNMVHTY